MSVLTWIPLGLGSLLLLSLLVGLAVGAILGCITRSVEAVAETEEWAVLPLTRGTFDVAPRGGRASHRKQTARIVPLR